MGYFSSLLDNTKATLNNSIIKSAKNATNSLLYGDVGDTGQINMDDYDIENSDGKNAKDVSMYSNVFANPTPNDYAMPNNERRISRPANVYNTVNDINHETSLRNGEYLYSISESKDNFSSTLAIPRWGIKDFINERVSWQKSLDSLTGEPGWFYFKIFFKFDTNYGLFGGVMRDGPTYFGSQNTAINYLKMHHSTIYTTVNANQHARMLIKFVNTLSWISCKAPWFFKRITDVNQASYVDLNNITKEKMIEIECSEDAVDMRLTTLMDMYRYVCYDYVWHREILPENLRKFDMSVVVFHTPIRYHQTAAKSLTKGTFPYKSMHEDKFGDTMSFRLVTFKNCEFDVSSMDSLPAEMNNEKAFSINNCKIKIKYDKAYITNLNEWFQFAFNSIDGPVWDVNLEDYAQNVTNNGIDDTPTMYNKNIGSQQKRIDAIKYAINHKFFYNPKSVTYKSLIDASEDVISNAMRMVDMSDAAGNLYNEFTDINGDYYKDKLAYENGKKFEKRTDGLTEKTKRTHAVIPDYADQKPINQHVAQGIDFASLHNKDIADANNPMSYAYQEKLRKFKKNKWERNDSVTNPESDDYKEKLRKLRKQKWSINEGPTNPESFEYQNDLKELKKQEWRGNEGLTNPMSNNYRVTLHDLKKQTWNGNEGPTNSMSDEYQQTLHDLRKQTWNGNEGPTNSMSDEYQQTLHDLRKQTWNGNEGPTNSMSDEYQNTLHDLRKQTWNGNEGPTNSMSDEYQQTLHNLRKQTWNGNEGPTNSMSDEYQQTLHDLRKQTWNGNEGHTNPNSYEYQQTLHDLRKQTWNGNEGPTNPNSYEYQEKLKKLKK